MGERLPAPALADDLHALLEELHTVLHGHVEGAEVGGLIADAHPEDDATLGDEIQRDDVLGHAHRVMQGEEDHRGADVEPARVRGDRGGHDQGRGQEAVLVLVMLAEEARIEAARLGQLRLGDDLVDGAIQILAPRRIGDRAVETEFHDMPPDTRFSARSRALRRWASASGET